jgi:hypothetical protein
LVPSTVASKPDTPSFRDLAWHRQATATQFSDLALQDNCIVS